VRLSFAASVTDRVAMVKNAELGEAMNRADFQELANIWQQNGLEPSRSASAYRLRR
jgi:hypothetical protein